jgi:hypothetical protein
MIKLIKQDLLAYFAEEVSHCAIALDALEAAPAPKAAWLLPRKRSRTSRQRDRSVCVSVRDKEREREAKKEREKRENNKERKSTAGARKILTNCPSKLLQTVPLALFL